MFKKIIEFIKGLFEEETFDIKFYKYHGMIHFKNGEKYEISSTKFVPYEKDYFVERIFKNHCTYTNNCNVYYNISDIDHIEITDVETICAYNVADSFEFLEKYGWYPSYEDVVDWNSKLKG